MKSSWLSKKYFHKFKIDPKRTVKGFRIDAIEDVRCNISINQAARAKKLAILKLQGNPSAQYALLWDYADEVKRSNPGSIAILGTNQNLFDRFYVLRMNFLAGCRPVICVDGCHLKGPHGGVLLAAVGIDLICYAVAYQYPIFPINGRDEWKKSDLSPPVPPKAVKRVGRPPKSSRRLKLDEPVQKNKNRRGVPMKEGSSRIKRQQTTVKCGKCGGQGHNARGYATKTASNEPVPDASSQVPPIEQPQKNQVRRKCKGIMQDADVVMHRRTRSGKIETIVASVQEEDGVMHRRTRSGHIFAAPVIRKLQDKKAPKPSATAPKPAPFIDVEVGGRSLDEQGSSGSTPIHCLRRKKVCHYVKA
ncbi:UNVERIFIED_CONTAM: hypothetical protein Sradi_5119600 [Sesamum radiatum]|uniref:Uncharacterized protein n=1 Tax=Sesamum radiatum TaxID=300843 RepID=A0AAW2M3D6_SESRA